VPEHDPTHIRPAVPTTIHVEKLAYSPAEAAAAIGVTRQTIQNLIRRGELKSTKIGACRRISRLELERLIGLHDIADGAA